MGGLPPTRKDLNITSLLTSAQVAISVIPRARPDIVNYRHDQGRVAALESGFHLACCASGVLRRSAGSKISVSTVIPDLLCQSLRVGDVNFLPLLDTIAE